MRRLTAATISALAITCSYVNFAGPASAIHHHHHHHHHHRSRGGGTCGPGTVNAGGVCMPAVSGPVGKGNVVIMPSDVTMTLDGLLVSSATISGLPPLTTVDSNSPITCGPGGAAIAVTPAKGIAVDALGRAQVSLTNSATRLGTPGCVPGTYPVTFSEGTTTPFETFTGFITLHF